MSAVQIHEVGTTRGYEWHRRQGEDACPECRAAKAEYQRQYRRRNPSYVAEDRANMAAYQRAQTRLARLFPDEFRRLYDEERAK